MYCLVVLEAGILLWFDCDSQKHVLEIFPNVTVLGSKAQLEELNS